MPVSISAYDHNSNNTTLDYLLHNSATASLESLMPADNSEFVTQGEPIVVQVAARVHGLVGTEIATVQYLLNNDLSSPVTMDISGTLASGMVTLPAVASQINIIISLHNQNGELITQSKIKVSIASFTDIPVEVMRIEPVNNSDFIEPNAPIEIYFNREIDLSLLSVQVRETLHGKTYLKDDNLGEDYLSSEGYKLVDVHRNLMPVLGKTELNPGGTGVAFYADKLFGFNAEVYVDVMYNAKEISRSFFSVRELPTLINGAVADQFGQPLAGVAVEIPELGRKTITDGDGGFAFGYQETGEQVIPSGQYSLTINKNFTTPNLGMLSTKISVQKNYGNQLERFTLQELDRTIAFENIRSGQINTLVGGDLILDLTQAKVLFDNGRTEGSAHLQFLPFEHIGTNMWPGAVPLWLYSSQPKGVTVEGSTHLTLKIPKLSGSYNYINPASYPYVVLVGYNANQEVIEPIGVGRVDNNKVVSVGSVNLTSLDFIGYAQVHQNLAETLISYAQGELSLQQLKAQLQAAIQGKG
ncbi:carboxypeptidase-like regulatory domain-containing protein [Colwellia sp. MSW7]|uniref:Carboxypeptidase-like regulatory domain-containing protein n=1 Tax=Colwellia maritima TaxID=2912588 RepID=A0ABS9X4V2_9GAMM|nr:carboxypeptidase-like regulatory domain-containing protein [Colwellia maritima]MCI2285241.1 carboxypeptidase-like regulatory domain-containing protein [Colwellia maritima]